MSQPATFILRDERDRMFAVRAVERAPYGKAVVIKEPTRSLEQNALLHAALSDISDQVEWRGQKFPLDVWKRLCTAAWLREKGEEPELIPALDGHGFDVIYERTSNLTISQCSELIEWCFAFGAQNGVTFKEGRMASG